MRKQTKIVAVASAAAILAIGASMTSFAATGWVEESGEWYYYDKDGNKVEDEWKKSGDSWYWLDSEESGAMAIDKLIDDGDNSYYVDSTGKMAANTWVKVVNEDQDDDDDPAEYNYYYMQSNGKAYKAGDSGSTKFRTIDGKKYAFDDDGKMLYGWVDGTGTRLSGEDDWATVSDDVYYCGEWEDGAMKTGWQKIYVHDADEDDDMEHWFWFKSNGKRWYSTKSETKEYDEKKINGKKYAFDDRGVMVYEWGLETAANASSSDSWKYFNSPEDGARMTKGWFKVIAPEEDNTFNSNTYDGTFASTHADDEEEKWYYADGDGKLATGEIKKIKGKYYAFRPDDSKKGAAMLSGLVLIKVVDGEIVDVLDDGVDSDELSDLLDDTDSYGVKDGYSLYYFGSDADSDGAMKTGSTTVTLDGDTYTFYFNKSGGVESRGKGVTGIDDNKYIYMYGCRIKADSDDKYQVVRVTGADTTIGTSDCTVDKVKSQDIRRAITTSVKNKDGDAVRYALTADFIDETDPTAPEICYLVNTSGTIVKSKTAAKDGDDWYFYVNDKQIRTYTNNKTLTGTKDNGTDLTTWKTVDVQ